MKALFTTTLLFCIFICFGQYNYGLEVDQQDAKIEGELSLGVGSEESIYIGIDVGQNITFNSPLFGSGTKNTYIGYNAGLPTTSGAGNTYLGWLTGLRTTTGSQNTIIGGRTGVTLESGDYNTFLGWQAGFHTTGDRNVLLGSFAGFGVPSGSGNVMIGYSSGYNNDGEKNIFIGDYAGNFETASNRLYIESADRNDPDNQTPLIYGEFDNDLLIVNGKLHISETAKLVPQSNQPTCTSNDMGTLYVDTGAVLYFCDGTMWKTVQLN